MPTQLSIFDVQRPFRARGPLLEAEDHTRLGSQLQAVLSVMRRGQWMTLRTLSLEANAPEASCSARLRDLRRPECGGYTVERKRLGNTFFYRLLV